MPSDAVDIVHDVKDAAVRASQATPVAASSDQPLRGPATFAPLRMSRERRPGWATLFALAMASGLAALGLGCWVLFAAERGPGSGATARESALESTVAVLASPRAVRVPLAGSAKRLVLVIAERGEAVLLVRGLGRAVTGRTYEAWVRHPGSAALLPAGLFDGSDGAVRVTRPVTPGSSVSVTVEDAGGAIEPSRIPRLTAFVP